LIVGGELKGGDEGGCVGERMEVGKMGRGEREEEGERVGRKDGSVLDSAVSLSDFGRSLAPGAESKACRYNKVKR